ncbi:RHS repeat-associated core domain-containing protein [Streptomyces niveus]|uniref:RHS repeat-associated core domain-containing protein n=1 Tax=Streptomyces niveus TaxID=193462 RepID=UPI00367C93A5
MDGRPSSRFRHWRGRVALASSVVLIGTLLQGAAQPVVAAADDRGVGAGIPASESPIEGSAGSVEPRTAMKEPRTPKKRPDESWPKAASGRVKLPSASSSAAVASPAAPVALGVPKGKTGVRARGEVEVRVLDRKTSERAGLKGPLFALRPVSGKADGAVKNERGATSLAGDVKARIDYSTFDQAYGGGYASRLTLVELPACAASTPEKAECRTGRAVPTVNDTEKRTLTAERVGLRAGVPTILAAVADAEGGTGTYKATPLSPSATWSTNLNTGDFNWSNDIPVPDVPGSLKPSFGLSYASGAIDGRTGSTNNQSSWVGDGFDLSPGFIERRFKPCAEDGVKDADGNEPGDQCWAYDNAFISFNGKGGELVPAGKDVWKLKGDDGTKIDRLTSTNRGNGDADGEYWRLTDPQGVRYYFGYHRLPGWAEGREATNSAWTAPVFGDDSGEPCHAATFAASWCQQAWRWNLDYVVDTRGNAVAYYYEKEENSYGRNLEAADNTRYTRGGYLDRIEYGLKSSSMYGTQALAQVDFTSSERCIQNTQTDCGSITTDSAYWYDTPWDLNCDAGEDCDDGRLSPAFFTRKRLTAITTQVLVAGGYESVDSWKLTHRWGMADIDYQLLLDSIQRTGHSASPAVTLPKTTFAYTQHANRLDKTGDGYAPFIKSRLSSVDDPTGGQLAINYTAAACDWNALPTPQSNATRCFPQYIGGSSSDDPERQWFNKYVVDSVTSSDRTGGAPDHVTRYQYLGNAAWHYDDDDGLTKEKHKTWSQWRGYGQVRVLAGGQGGADAMKSQEDQYFLRGMDGDRKEPSGGTKSVSVTLAGGEGDPITDHESAAGFAYKTVTYSGPGGKILAKTVNRPWHHQTAKKERDWGTVTANFTGTTASKKWTSLDDGVGTKWRTTSTGTAYDTVAGRVTAVDDFGDTTTSTDNKCARTTYATNTEKNILSLPSRSESVATSCDATAQRPADVLSDSRIAYDGVAYDAPPEKGDVTATAVLKKYNGTTPLYLESGATFDSYGRVLTNTDLTADVTVNSSGAVLRTPRTDGRTTTTVRTPATGFATDTTVTGPPARNGDATTAQKTTSTFAVSRGLPLTQTDTNGKVTTFAYDALGRSTKVWLADQLTGQTPAYEFTYRMTEGHPVAVGTKLLGNRGVQRTSYTIFDGLMRERQAQEPGPDGGRILTDVFYDERGLTAKRFAPYYVTEAPTTTLFEPDNALSVETQSRHTFDGLGRETEARQIAGNGDGGAVVSTTRTIYGGDRVTVIPPAGGTATTTLTDARNRTTELRQHHQRTAGSAYDTMAYQYTPRDEMAKVTDAAGNWWSYTYDLLGRQIESVDPDKGTTTSTYDDRGLRTSTKDAEGTTLAYVYDGLGRQTELREGSNSGALRAKWVYDTISGAKGHLAESIRYAGGEQYTSKVVAYDRRYRVQRSSITIPGAEDELAGTYVSGTEYNVSGSVQSVGYPKAGALAPAVVGYTYEDATERLLSVTGMGQLSSTATYSLTGKPLQYRLSAGGKFTQATNTYEWGTQRLATSRVDRQDIAGVDQFSTFRYDEAGNVLSVSDTSRAGNDTQCFTYDYLRRLTEAWAQGQSTCPAEPAGGAAGGPAPYRHSYTYDKVGNRLTETIHDPAGDSAKDTLRTYAYPDPGTPQPHKLTSITQAGPTGTARDTFGYDDNGSTTSRTVAGDEQTLTWDAEGRLATVSEPVESGPAKVTSYLYDAEGNRLIGRTAEETTLYLGTTEIVLPKGSITPKATRYVDLGGGHQAVQKDDGTISLTIADHHGTAQLAVDAATQQLTQRRTLPFGGTRGEDTGTWPGTKGFVGGTLDAATGLTRVGAREYDPSTGRFLSVDPVMDLADPQQIHGYAYANNNPLTWSDPTGLWCDSCNGGAGWPSEDGYTEEVPYEPNNIPDVGSGGGGGGGGGGSGGGGGGGGGKKPVYVGIDIPSEKELRAAAHGYYIDQSYTQLLVHWADEECNTTPNGALCAAVHELGWVTPTKDFLELIGVRDAQRCFGGSVSACVWTVAGFIPIGRLGTASKLLKKGDDAGAARLACATPHSFPPGTEVLLADGTTKPIEDVKLGDVITVTDPLTGETTIRKVVATIVTEDDKRFVDLTVRTEGGDSSELISTVTHPFWVESSKTWTEAGNLKPGMTLRTATGDTAEVEAVRSFDKRQRTYDLTVEGIHTYYVLAGSTPVLVHNCNTAPDDLLDLDKASASGQVADKSGTKAGRALQKHADDPVTGSNWPRPAGKENPQGWSEAGQERLNEILTNPGTRAHMGWGRLGGKWQETLDLRHPDGWGARFDWDGNLSGFLD